MTDKDIIRVVEKMKVINDNTDNIMGQPVTIEYIVLEALDALCVEENFTPYLPKQPRKILKILGFKKPKTKRGITRAINTLLKSLKPIIDDQT